MIDRTDIPATFSRGAAAPQNSFRPTSNILSAQRSRVEEAIKVCVNAVQLIPFAEVVVFSNDTSSPPLLFPLLYRG